MIVKEKLTANANGTIQNTKRLFVVVALLLLITGCQEKQLNDEIVVTETAVPTAAATIEVKSFPEIEGKIAITSPDPVNVTMIAAADLAAANIEPLPASVSLASDVYAIDAGDTAVTGHIAINTPANADVTLLDLYGWNGTSWTFIPSEYDPATQQRHTAGHILFQAVALGQAEPPNQMTVGGVWRDEANMATWPEQFTETIVGTLYLGADGELEGSLSDVHPDIANPYIQLTNVNDEIESEALSTLLADAAAQTAQIEAIVEMVEPYAGVNLNYQGIDASQKEAFTTFVHNLSDALEAQEKNLILTLPAPQNADEMSNLEGYDWPALGNIADSIYLQLPLHPHGYEAEGTVEQSLAWATEKIDRRKLVALIPTSAVVHSGDTWAALTAEELRMHFGNVQFVTNSSAYEPETPIEATLSGNISPIQWDEVSSAYYYTYEDGELHEVWLVHPVTIAYRTETAVKHNLQGIAFTTPTQLPDPAQAVDPALVWTVLDDEENIVVTQSGNETSFTWEGASDPGDFTLQVDFVSGDVTTSLDTLPIVVAAAEGTEESEEDAEIVTGIIKWNANVRVGPGESYDKFPFPLLGDTEVEIIGRDEFGYWLQIVFSNIDGEQTGWIASSLVNVDPAFEIDMLADTSATVSAVAKAPVTGFTPESATPAPAPSSGPPPPVSAPPVAVGGFELGGQTHTFSNPVLMASAGMTWVKFQHKWGEGSNPNDLAGRINNAHAAGFKVLLSIPGANTYPESINFEAYVQFLAGVAALGPDAIEVWNEMNIDFEWPAGQIDPNSYVNNMLAPAYNAIKSVNPNVMVISGAPAPTGFDNNTNAWADNRYMAGMLAAGAASYADCIGAHYNAGASSPSSISGHPTGSAHYSWYLLPTLNVYAQLGKSVCFTELGYLSGEDYGGVPERFAWAAETSVAEHAAWLAEAVSVAANTGKVRMIIVFNVDFTHYGDDPQAGYAMIRKDGGCPACETLARVMGR
jgi:spore germination protein YaaH